MTCTFGIIRGVTEHAGQCAVETCSRAPSRFGWCPWHYTNWLRHGDPVMRRTSAYTTESEARRFWAKVDKTARDGCWVWTASHVRGYGRFTLYGNGPCVRAHRWAYEHIRGPIPDGLQLDHLCKNKGCVNPDHLEAVTAAVNTLRSENIAAKNARKTHCKRGHPLSGENVYPIPSGGRSCRICRAAADRRYKDKNRKIAV